MADRLSVPGAAAWSSAVTSRIWTTWEREKAGRHSPPQPLLKVKDLRNQIGLHCPLSLAPKYELHAGRSGSTVASSEERQEAFHAPEGQAPLLCEPSEPPGSQGAAPDPRRETLCVQQRSAAPDRRNREWRKKERQEMFVIGREGRVHWRNSPFPSPCDRHFTRGA